MIGAAVKKYGSLHEPYPEYLVPFRYRGDRRLLHYHLKRDEHGVFYFRYSMVCQAVAAPFAHVGDPCMCCSEFNQVDHLSAFEAVTADITQPGEPLE